MIDQDFFLITYNDDTLYHAIPDSKYPIYIGDNYIKIPCHPIAKIAEFINKLSSVEDVFLRIYLGHSKVLIKELFLSKKWPSIEVVALDMIYVQLEGTNVKL